MLNASSFRELLSKAREEHADSPFFVADDLLGRVTYTDLFQFARGVEQQLDALNIPIGGPVASVLHNCGISALMFLAIISARRLYVPLNPASTQSELEYMLGRTGCQLVIVDPLHARSAAFGERSVVHIVDHFSYFSERCKAALRDGSFTQPSRVALVGEVIFTSGSTGRPKGVVLTEQNLLSNASALIRAYHLSSADRFLTICPLFHNSGQIFTTLACALVGGSTVAIKSDIGMLRFWRYVDKYRVHWSLGMTSFLALLLARDDDPHEWRHMRALLTGGSAIDAQLIRKFESRFSVPVRTVYGLTESSSIAACEHIDPRPRSLGSSGRVLEPCEVRIQTQPRSISESVSAGTRIPGEIWISGPTLFDHYIGDPELTQSRKQDNWLRTGDLGYFDEHGNLFVIDRLDSMLIVGGENVYPAEIERLCSRLPDAAQIVLIGIDHAIWGKELVLIYKSLQVTAPPLGQWHRIFSEHLAPFKIPQRYFSLGELNLEDFPRKENGKLDRPAITSALKARLSRAGNLMTEDR